MTQIALIGIPVLRLAPLNRAMPHHLAAVQKRLRLRVEELQRRATVQHACAVERLDKALANRLVHRARMTQARSLVD